MLRNYLKIAWRNLRKSKGYATINILGLAVGMAITLLIALWMYDELSFDKYHTHYDQLAAVKINQTFAGNSGVSAAISLPIRKVLEEKYGDDFEALSLGTWTQSYTLRVGEKMLPFFGMYVEPAFPGMFSLQMIEGDATKTLQEINSILIAKSVAVALFGTEENLIGKIIRVDNKNEMQVAGVFEDLPTNTTLSDNKVFLPWARYRADEEWVRNSESQWDNHSFPLFAQLAPQADFDKTEAKFKDEEKPHIPADINPEFVLHAMKDWHLRSEFKNGKLAGGRISYVRMFGFTGLFVLLLACINFMNLSTARSEKRAREVGIRKAIGSSRKQLIGQFLGESFLVTFIAALLCIVLVWLALPWFNQVSSKSMKLPVDQWWFWTSIVTVTIFTGLVAGSYPALYLSSFQPLSVLKGSFKAGRYASAPRKILVTMQFVISVALIIGTLVVFRQIQYAKERPVGYNRDGLIHVLFTSELYEKREILRDELKRTGVVEQVAVSSNPITDIWSNQIGFDWPGRNTAIQYLFGTVSVGTDFGKTVGWNMIDGRDFSKEYGTDSSALILNQAAVAQIGMDSIVGKVIKYNEEPYTVIGVVENMVMESPYDPIKPTIFLLDNNWANIVSIRMKPELPLSSSLVKIEAAFKQLDPNTPVSIQFTDQNYENKFLAETRVGKLAAIFAGFAIFISALGLLGLASFMAEQRTKEIGIRKVLGSSVAQVWALLSKEFLLLAFLGMLIATPIAWFIMHEWLQNFEYRSNLPWYLFALTYFVGIVITIISVSFQAVRAAKSNPVKSLRTE